jgi:hypothetical protein
MFGDQTCHIYTRAMVDLSKGTEMEDKLNMGVR